MSQINNNPNNLNEIETRVFNEFSSIVNEYSTYPKGSKSTKWLTTEIKRRVANIGFENKFEARSSFNDGEWLYDLVWYKNNSDNFLEKVDLVLESELSDRTYAGLQLDFEKLLISNAPYKVMICMAEGNYDYPQNINRVIDLFEKAVVACRNLQSGARVLVLIWEDYMEGAVHPHLIIKE